MFKKIVLVGLLIMLLSSVVYAPEYTISTEKAPIIIEKTIDEIGTVTTEDLWVWLEVPEQLPPLGQTFLVDLYITLYKPSLAKTLTLKLKPSNSKVKFTGGVQDLGIYTYIFSKDKWSKVYASPNDGSILLSRLFGDIGVSGISTYKKLFVARLEMFVNEPGSFQILLVGDESEAWYSPSNKYILQQGNTRIVRNTQCIPYTNSVACSNKCGKVDNGCGKIVSCGNTCLSGQVCSTNNDCVDAPSQYSPEDKELCEAVIKVPETADKTLLQKMGETLSGWGQSCTTNTECKAGYPNCLNNKCTATPLSVLSPIFAALTDWLGIKFQ